MRKASAKDIMRTIWKEKKRFFSIMMITILGVTLMTGLEAGCRDLKISADRFYDSQNLFDISIMSTLGLTEEDIEVISAMDGVQKAEGAFSQVVHTKKGERNQTAEVKVFQENGLNIPYVKKGRLPESGKEIAVSENYLKETGKALGDSLIIEEIMTDSVEKDGDLQEESIGETEEETPNFPNKEFTIVGTVVDVMDINNAEGSAAFRATPNADYTFFVTWEAVDSDVYTAVYALLEGSKELLCYSDEYEGLTEAFIGRIETEIMSQREEARYQQITKEAYEKIAEKEEEMLDTFIDVEKELEDAKEDISQGLEELADGRQELVKKEQEAKEQIADARKELEDAQVQLEDAWFQLTEAEKQLNTGEAELEEGKELLRAKEEEAATRLEEAKKLLESNISSNNHVMNELMQQAEQVKALFGTKWSASVSVPNPESNGNFIDKAMENAWNEYLSATTTLLTPLIAGQMNAEGAMSEAMLQQAIAAAVGQAAAENTEINGVGYQTTTAVFQAVLQKNIETLQQEITAYIASITSENALVYLQQQLSAATLGTEEYNQIATQLSILNWDAAIAGKEAGADTKNLMSLVTGISTCNATSLAFNKAMSEYQIQKEYALGQMEEAWSQLLKGEQELAEGRKQLTEGREEVLENYRIWQDGVKELEEKEQEAQREIADAWKELADGEQELADGKQELEEHEKEYYEERAEAEEKIAEAKQKVADIDMTKWYVQDRTSLSGYVNVDSDTACIESLATVFTIVFFVVAILISLTTVTRMVEEERGLIGTYKALGFTDGEIRKKYTLYALGASALGAVLGDVGGFVILPKILFVFFQVMYLFPNYYLKFDIISGTLSGVVFIIGIAGAAVAACYSELKHVPADLMRPKAPKEGSRVFLEYIKPLWKRMSFLNKVTARNLFRYKKRMFMTLFGIMGCTALLVFGLAIKDSVAELMPLQYEEVYSYDLLAATSAEDNEKLISYMEKSKEVREYLNLQVETVKLKNEESASEKVQLMIFPDGADISPYFTLKDENENSIHIGNEGIYLTENASKILGLEAGATAYIQKLDLTQQTVTVTGLVKNYLGNNIYMSESAYKAVFGTYEPNGILAILSENCENQIAFSDKLSEEDWMLSSVSTQDLKESFSQAFTLINLVVYVVLVLAACLAFVVLFTLASINISERERELATIKVLGFHDKEVHSYVNKETLILTGMGILIGLPVGAGLSSLLTDILNMPSIYFAVTIYGRSYWMAAGIALLFAFMVQCLTDRTLNAINPVEALKSVE